MTKVEIEQKLTEFLEKEKKCAYNELDDLCKQYGMRRLAQRKPSAFGKRNAKIPNTRWESIDLENCTFDKPVVVCLSGNGASDAAYANGFCKMVENMLGLLFTGQNVRGKTLDYVDLIGCAYGKSTKYLYFPDDVDVQKLYKNPIEYAKDFPQAIKESYEPNDLSPSEVEKFAENLLLKGCIDANGNKLSLDTCCKNLSQITFCSFCYGARAVKQIVEAFENLLNRHNFSVSEINKIKNSMMHVSFARLDYARNIPSAYFYSVDDYDIGPMLNVVEEMNTNDIRLKTRYCKVGENAIGQDVHPHRFGTHSSCEALEYVYKGAPQEDGPSLEHYVSNVGRDMGWNIINKKVVMYDAISQMMSWALSRAVENGLQNAKSDKYIPKKPMEELNKEIISIYKSFDKEESKRLG